jgi:hypothetical protein
MEDLGIVAKLEHIRFLRTQISQRKITWETPRWSTFRLIILEKKLNYPRSSRFLLCQVPVDLLSKVRTSMNPKIEATSDLAVLRVTYHRIWALSDSFKIVISLPTWEQSGNWTTVKCLKWAEFRKIVVTSTLQMHRVIWVRWDSSIIVRWAEVSLLQDKTLKAQ